MILEIIQLRLAYGSRILAPDISFHLEGGECVLLAGANGCGKSTLLRTLAGEGTDAASLLPSRTVRQRVLPVHTAMVGHRFRHTRPLRPNAF